MEQINVEKLMEQIRAEIAEKGYTAAELDFQDVDGCGGAVVDYNPKVLQTALQEAEEGFIVRCRDPYAGNPVKVFIKKVLRKLMLFFVEPIVAQQNAYNSAVTQALAQLDARAREAEARVAALEKQLAALQIAAGTEADKQ